MTQYQPHLTQSLRSHVRRRVLMYVSAVLVIIGADRCKDSFADEAGEVLASIPVIILSAPTQDETMNSPAAIDADEPPQVTPAAKMPQYQLRSNELIDMSPPDSPAVRFLLTAPSQLLLIEAAVYIDGVPFRQIRERRIEEIQAWMQQSPVFTPSETYSPPAGLQDRIQRYVASTGVPPATEELRWLLSQWVDGPPILLLNENFQRFRAEQQPLFHVLDKDRDGLVSLEERTAADATLAECDLNRDDVIESTEIARVAADPRNWKPPATNRLRLIHVFPTDTPLGVNGTSLGVDGTSIWESVKTAYGTTLNATLIQSMDTDGDGVLNSAECQSLLSHEPDLRLRVDFNSTHAEASRLSVVDGSVTVRDAILQLDLSQSINNQILIPLAGVDLEVSAVQGTSTDQISVGAINDGYAMLPEIDPNGDGRLTLRERRQLLQRLTAFDRNEDGSIHLSECRPVIRLCLGFGPYAHEPLSTVRNAGQSNVADSSGPDWFQQMDKNRDNDLTRQEFPGTDEQFKSLDADQDGFISATEAVQSES